LPQRVRAQPCKRRLTPGSRLVPVVAQRQLRLALEEVQHGGHGGGVFGQFLALTEAEDHRLQPVAVEQRAAEDALVGRLTSFARSLMSV
jgi:hypothetical protein